jgi:drug/metabolite transporter (DMT)-like permease
MLYLCETYGGILGMVGIGGLFVMGGGYLPGTASQALGALSVLLASVNVAGGFVITKRMLNMFKSNCSSQSPMVCPNRIGQDLEIHQSIRGFTAFLP